jgi:hypothetical protein
MGILIIADGAGIGCANWVLRAIVAELAPLLETDGAPELAQWLTGETSPVALYGVLDVRQLTEENQRAFRNAIGPAFREVSKRGPLGWNDPKFWPGYLGLFASLSQQAALLALGQKPDALPNLNGVRAHDGSRSGPGW